MRRSLVVRLSTILGGLLLLFSGLVAMLVAQVSGVSRGYEQLLATEVRSELLTGQAQVAFKT